MRRRVDGDGRGREESIISNLLFLSSISFLFLVLGKILNREVILPLFHCYIGEPPSCLLDVLFDPLSFSSNLTYLEHSFFSSASPRLPPACKISLKMQQQQGELIDSIQKTTRKTKTRQKQQTKGNKKKEPKKEIKRNNQKRKLGRKDLTFLRRDFVG